MSLPLLPAARPPVRNASSKLATSIVAGLAIAFLSLALSTHVSAQSPPTVAPNPSFPVGTLRAFPSLIQTGIKPTLQWSTNLPPGTNTGDYTFFIRQTQQPSGVVYQIPVEGSGETLSPIPINPGFATFELWSVKAAEPVRLSLLDSTTVGSYLPMAQVRITSQDPYSIIPRTRADKPFSVQVTTTGLMTDPSAPESSKSVTLMRHTQSYGATGTGDPLDRTLATLHSQSSITENGTTDTAIPLNAIPGENRAKIRGEERFSIFSKEVTATDPNNGSTYQMPAYHLDSQTVQVWPVADASITGITQGQILGTNVPRLTCQLNDLYPRSTTWAQVYQGAPQDGITGTTIPGTTITINDSVPANRTVVIENYGAYVGTDGLWTIELLTQTPFGTDRIAQVSFIVSRANASITGINHGQILGTAFPQLTCQLNDLYQKSATWAQVYQGAPRDGIIGTIIPDSVISLNTVFPTNSIITLNNYSSLLTSDGVWTMEVLTQTSFGTFRLAQVSFIVNRTGTTIADWRQTHFGSPSNTGDAADENDYDHDGIPNAIEFAFGFDPKQSNAAQLPQPQLTAGQLALRFTPPAGITGIRYGAEWSTTLQPGSWTPVPNTGALPEQLFTVPTAGKPSLYLRFTTDLAAP